MDAEGERLVVIPTEETGCADQANSDEYLSANYQNIKTEIMNATEDAVPGGELFGFDMMDDTGGNYPLSFDDPFDDLNLLQPSIVPTSEPSALPLQEFDSFFQVKNEPLSPSNSPGTNNVVGNNCGGGMSSDFSTQMYASQQSVYAPTAQVHQQQHQQQQQQQVPTMSPQMSYSPSQQFPPIYQQHQQHPLSHQNQSNYHNTFTPPMESTVGSQQQQMQDFGPPATPAYMDGSQCPQMYGGTGMVPSNPAYYDRVSPAQSTVTEADSIGSGASCLSECASSPLNNVNGGNTPQYDGNQLPFVTPGSMPPQTSMGGNGYSPGIGGPLNGGIHCNNDNSNNINYNINNNNNIINNDNINNNNSNNVNINNNGTNNNNNISGGTYNDMIMQCVMQDIRSTCQNLNINSDPGEWSAEDVRSWIQETVRLYRLAPVYLDNFLNMGGQTFIRLTTEDFFQLAPDCAKQMKGCLEIWISAHEYARKNKNKSGNSTIPSQPQFTGTNTVPVIVQGPNMNQDFNGNSAPSSYTSVSNNQSSQGQQWPMTNQNRPTDSFNQSGIATMMGGIGESFMDEFIKSQLANGGMAGSLPDNLLMASDNDFDDYQDLNSINVTPLSLSTSDCSSSYPVPSDTNLLDSPSTSGSPDSGIATDHDLPYDDTNTQYPNNSQNFQNPSSHHQHHSHPHPRLYPYHQVFPPQSTNQRAPHLCKYPIGPMGGVHVRHSHHIHLWQFIRQLLEDPAKYSDCVRWISMPMGIFKIDNSSKLAKLWGGRKNRPAMNYDKLSRSLRQYYKKGILQKTPRSQRLVYQFCHPYNL